jgi:hypothetical protein
VAVAGQGIENVVPAVGTGTVMEDALEPSLGAVIVVATPEKAWSQRLNQLQRGLWSIFLYFFIRICGLTNSLCFPMIPMTVSFLPNKVKQSERH